MKTNRLKHKTIIHRELKIAYRIPYDDLKIRYAVTLLKAEPKEAHLDEIFDPSGLTFCCSNFHFLSFTTYICDLPTFSRRIFYLNFTLIKVL